MNEKQMITMEYVDINGNLHRVQVDVNGMATDFIDTFRAFLYVCGFHADTIADLLNDEIKQNYDCLDSRECDGISE